MKTEISNLENLYRRETRLKSVRIQGRPLKNVHFVPSGLSFLCMFRQIDTKDPAVVELEVQSRYLAMFPYGDQNFVPRAFGWAIDSFTGRRPGYQAIDASYHDFEHTLQGTL